MKLSINIYNIKKWYKMLAGKSILHVNQTLGKVFVPGQLKGYFNSMDQKVLMLKEILDTDELPTLEIENGDKIEFPVAIFQYGLGAYDLFIETGDLRYLKKFQQCCKWAVAHQEENGAWNNFFYIYPEHPYGSMAQGEGASLLLRAFSYSNDQHYFECGKKALDFMLLPISRGGTALYTDDGIILQEYTHLSTVLNGWIFSIFGLYDMTLINNEKIYKDALASTINCLVAHLQKFDCKYWSYYDESGKISSPFYHKLHIAQLEALYKITNNPIFGMTRDKFEKYSQTAPYKVRAFIKKAFQKIIE